MPGPLRAIAYRVAAATGFRVSELRSLTHQSFRLTGDKPANLLAPGATKNRRGADQPISSALAADLRRWIAEMPPAVPAFPLDHETSKAIRLDLERADIPYETAQGVADFHSLRAYFISAFVRAGASINTIQALARHAKAQTTLNH
jgi:integrase